MDTFRKELLDVLHAPTQEVIHGSASYISVHRCLICERLWENISFKNYNTFTLLASLGERTWADRRLGARCRGRADRTCKCHLSSHLAFWFSVALMHQTARCKGQNIFLKTTRSYSCSTVQPVLLSYTRLMNKFLLFTSRYRQRDLIISTLDVPQIIKWMCLLCRQKIFTRQNEK